MQWLIDSNDVLKLLDNEITSSEVIQKSWVSVKDRLPKPGELYLVWHISNEVEIFHYDYIYGGKKLCFYRDDENGYPVEEDDWVTHWMPLPEPPSGTK